MEGGVLRNCRGGARSLASVVERAGERAGKLGGAGDLELVADAVEVHLGGSAGDEQRLGDLAVGEAFGGESRNAQLAGSQGVAAGDRVPARVASLPPEIASPSPAACTARRICSWPAPLRR